MFKYFSIKTDTGYVSSIRTRNSTRAFLGMFLIFQIFDCFVNIVNNFNPYDAQNVRKCLN